MRRNIRPAWTRWRSTSRRRVLSILSKDSPDICVHDPADALSPALFTPRVERRMRAATRPKAIGAVVKVLLVHRFQPHRHRSLDALVLERRLPDRALPPALLLDPAALPRRGLVASAAQTLVPVA